VATIKERLRGQVSNYRDRAAGAPGVDRPEFQRVRERRLASHEEWRARQRSTIEELAGVLENYRPVSLLELVDQHPEDAIELREQLLEEAEQKLAGKYSPPESEYQLEDVPTNFRWLSGVSITAPVMFGYVRHILRTLGRDMMREELRKFAARIDKYYVLVPRDHEEPTTEGESTSPKKQTP
jgi:hypothetical protein